MPQEDKKTKYDQFDKKLLFIALVLSLCGLAIFIVTIWSFSKGENLALTSNVNDSKLGNLGSLISGTVGVFWSAVSILLVFIALGLQRKELSLQREDLELTRNELKGQRTEMEMQNYTLKQQRFENTFFHMLNLHNEIVDKISITDHGVVHEKRNFFIYAFAKLQEKREGDLSASYENDEDTLEVITEAYNNFNLEFGSYLNHYFRNLYHIYKYLFQSSLITESEKHFYSNIVRAQLSNYELVLIFYNCLIEGFGFPKFMFLEQEYEILKNLDDTLLFNFGHNTLFQRKKVINSAYVFN